MFVEEYLKDLRRARYGHEAVVRYVRRCAARSADARARRPRAVAGILTSGAVLVVLVAGLAFLLSGTIGMEGSISMIVGAAIWIAAGMAWMGFHLDMLAEGPATPIGIPNALTLGRLAAIPVFNVLVVRGHLAAAMIALVVGGLTDVADGIIARRFHASTHLGKVFDPIVDVLFNFGVAVGLTRAGLLPWWILGLVALRYGLLLFGAAWIYVARGPVRVRPTPLGKTTGVINTVVLLALVGLHTFVHPAEADPILIALYALLALVFSLTIIQVVIIGLYNLRHLGDDGPGGRLFILVGRDPKKGK